MMFGKLLQAVTNCEFKRGVIILKVQLMKNQSQSLLVGISKHLGGAGVYSCERANSNLNICTDDWRHRMLNRATFIL